MPRAKAKGVEAPVRAVPDGYIGVRQAAERIGYSLSVTYRMAKGGEIPGVTRLRPKGRILIDLARFTAWLQSQSEGGVA